MQNSTVEQQLATDGHLSCINMILYTLIHIPTRKSKRKKDKTVTISKSGVGHLAWIITAIQMLTSLTSSRQFDGKQGYR